MPADQPDRTPWDTNNPDLVKIYCAALTGIIANPAFFGAIYQGAPSAAVDFANQIVCLSTGKSDEQF